MRQTLKCCLIFSFVLALPVTASAEAVSFDAGWKHQKFSLFSKNDYGYGGRSLSIGSEGSVSLIYKPLPEAQWGSTSAAWSWAVERSVPATDLRNKGGDDRNIALYAVFMPRAEATRLKGASVAKLLSNDQVRVLVYVWCGSHKRGASLASPYLGRAGRQLFCVGQGRGRIMRTSTLPPTTSGPLAVRLKPLSALLCRRTATTQTARLSQK